MPLGWIYRLKAGMENLKIGRIYVVPGNGGTARGLRNVSNVSEVKPDDFPGLVDFASKHNVNLVVPGPEAPLVAGIESHFRKSRHRRYSPTYRKLMRWVSRHTMFWSYPRGRSHGGFEDVFEGLHG